jgi:hypothetical protein
VAYAIADTLYNDMAFRGRVRACTVEQADSFRADTRPDVVALSNSLLRGEANSTETFIRLTASAPGIADSADTGGGNCDQTKVTDLQLLSSVQNGYPMVAGLYYNPDGSLRPPGT